MDIERPIQGEVLQEFEVDGKSAQIIRLQMGDIGPADLEAHARNLAKSNFEMKQLKSCINIMRNILM